MALKVRTPWFYRCVVVVVGGVRVCARPRHVARPFVVLSHGIFLYRDVLSRASDQPNIQSTDRPMRAEGGQRTSNVRNTRDGVRLWMMYMYMYTMDAWAPRHDAGSRDVDGGFANLDAPVAVVVVFALDGAPGKMCE